MGENIRAFRRAYDTFAVLVIGFLLYTYALVIAWNLGYEFDLLGALAPAFDVLYIGLGYLLQRAERNWFIGIRTPWTVSSEQVWRETDELSATLFKVAGVLAIGGFVFPRYAIYFIVAPAVGVALFGTVYSFIRYRRLNSESVATIR